MPAPAHQANSSQQTNVGAITVAWPAHSISDLGLLLLQTSNEAITEGDTDFVSLGSQGAGTPASAGATLLSIFWARAASAAMPSVVTSDSGDHQTGHIETYRGAYVGRDPILVGFNTGTGTAVTFPAGTTDADNATVLMIVAHSNDANGALVTGQANSSLTSLTEVFDNGANTGTGGGVCVTSGILAAEGSFVAGTATLSTSATWVSATVVIHSLAAPAFVDAAAPEIVNIGPDPIGPNDPVTWTVIDDTGLRSVVVMATFPGSGIDGEVVFDSERFRGLYRNALGTATGTSTERIYTAWRSGGWPSPPKLEWVVADTSGNLGVIG